MTETEHLASLPAFRDLPEDTLEALLSVGDTIALDAGDEIGKQQLDSQLLILLQGSLELEGDNGERLREGPGLVLGLDTYLEQETPYYHTARGLRPGRMLCVPFQRLRTLEECHPGLAGMLNRVIADRIRHRGLSSETGPRGALAQQASRVMSSPLATCDADWTLGHAFETMRARKIGSMGVTGADGRLRGVVTMTSLANAAMRKEARPVDDIRAACTDAETVTAETPLWRAEALRKRKGVKYLVVTDDDRPVGMLSQTDILQALLAQQDALLDRIGRCTSLQGLRSIHDDVLAVARDAWQRNRDVNRAVLVINDFHLAIQRRCAELTLDEIAAEGHGEAPRPYALIILGSGGRREMLINPDQDNGIIIGDGEALAAEEAEWFATFTDRFNRNLDTAGYILCPGDIMARNPAYQKTLGGWSKQIRQVCQHLTLKSARWANILFDFDLLYGDARLYSALWTNALDILADNPRLLGFMVRDDAEGTPALGLFNRLVAAANQDGDGRIDIKRQGLRLICNAARIHCLHAGISETNTVERLRALVRQGELSADFADSVIAAYEEFMDLLLAHQIRQTERGETPDKLINADELTPLGRESLRMGMHAVKRFQDRLQGRFGL